MWRHHLRENVINVSCITTVRARITETLLLYCWPCVCVCCRRCLEMGLCHTIYLSIHVYRFTYICLLNDAVIRLDNIESNCRIINAFLIGNYAKVSCNGPIQRTFSAYNSRDWGISQKYSSVYRGVCRKCTLHTYSCSSRDSNRNLPNTSQKSYGPDTGYARIICSHWLNVICKHSENILTSE
jgi:hypothetical protein